MKIFQKPFLRSDTDYTSSGASISEVRNFQYNFLLSFPHSLRSAELKFDYERVSEES